MSIEQDLGLAAEILGHRGRAGILLYAAGRRGSVVQIEDPNPRGDPLARQLGDLFAPRGGRNAHYRPTQLSPDGPATADHVLATLDHQLAHPGRPLWIYLAGHGDFGQQPADNLLGLWAQSALDAKTLARHLDAAKRPVRVVVTSCYSGGFAELAFAMADPKNGPPTGERCGLFATTWDLEASGCDPNPDRRVQQGFGLHMLHALRGEDRHGNRLDADAIDFDGDGKISLLEAHARARIASEGIDVPTTTSERWLRVHSSERAPTDRAIESTPEDRAVIEAFATEFPQLKDPTAARTELAGYERTIEATRSQLTAAQQQEDAAYRMVAGELLALFPVLDDPWHPDFTATLADQRQAIQGLLDHSQAYADYLSVREHTLALDTEVGVLRGKTAKLERYVRAVDNGELAGRIRAAGGVPWNVYQQLLACERASLDELDPAK